MIWRRRGLRDGDVILAEEAAGEIEGKIVIAATTEERVIIRRYHTKRDPDSLFCYRRPTPNHPVPGGKRNGQVCGDISYPIV